MTGDLAERIVEYEDVAEALVAIDPCIQRSRAAKRGSSRKLSKRGSVLINQTVRRCLIFSSQAKTWALFNQIK